MRRETGSKTQLTLAQVCEAIAQGRLTTSVDYEGWYVVKERDIAMMLGTSRAQRQGPWRPCYSFACNLN